MTRLIGKVALVTGAGSMGGGLGNGKAAAIQMAREGVAVLAMDRDLAAAQVTCEIIESEGGQARPLCADVTDESAIKDMIAQGLRVFGHVDILVNNVGILRSGGAADTSVEDWEFLANVNLKAVFLPTKHVLPHFFERGAGVVVNMSSLAGQRYLGAPYIAYNATKGAIISYTRNLAAEVAPHGIRANAILPGFIDTPMARAAVQQGNTEQIEIDWQALDQQRAARVPLGRVGTPWDIAKAASFLASDDASYITGTELIVDGGVSACV